MQDTCPGGGGSHSPGCVTEHSHDLVQNVRTHDIAVGEQHLVHLASCGLADLDRTVHSWEWDQHTKQRRGTSEPNGNPTDVLTWTLTRKSWLRLHPFPQQDEATWFPCSPPAAASGRSQTDAF